MTDDERELVEASQALAAAQASPWQPRCIARAFARPRPGEVAFTMQAWIDLDAAQSPLLVGEAPATAEGLDAAFAAFGLAHEELTPEETVAVVRALLRAIDAGFAAALRMQPPGESTSPAGDDGFGDWAPIFACLVVQCRLSLAEARALRVDAAHILMATMRRNERWTVSGVPYALRDLEEASRG